MKSLRKRFLLTAALLLGLSTLPHCSSNKNIRLSVTVTKAGVPMHIQCEGRRAWPDWKSQLVPAPGFVGMDITPHSIHGSATIPCHADEGFYFFMHARHMPVELRLTCQGPEGVQSTSVTLTGKEQPVHSKYELEEPDYCVYYIADATHRQVKNGQIVVYRSSNYTLSAEDVAKCEQMKPVPSPSE